jgi:single-stranded DNA-binding protein
MSGIEAAFFGALGRDGELKTSKNGNRYLRLNVRAGDGDGVQWISVLAFDETATELAERFVKGARVYIEGAIRIEEWTAQDGTKRAGLTCIAGHCRLSAIGRNRPKKENSKPNSATSPSRPANDFHDDPVPF